MSRSRIVARRQRGMRSVVSPTMTRTGAETTSDARRCARGQRRDRRARRRDGDGQRHRRTRERRERADDLVAGDRTVERAPGRAAGDRDVQAAANEPRVAGRGVDGLRDQLELVVEPGVVRARRRRDDPSGRARATAGGSRGRSRSRRRSRIALSTAAPQSATTPSCLAVSRNCLPPALNVTGTVASLAAWPSSCDFAWAAVRPPTSIPPIRVPAASRFFEPAKKSGSTSTTAIAATPASPRRVHSRDRAGARRRTAGDEAATVR